MSQEQLPPFFIAWQRREAQGFKYGLDAMSNARVGYELAAEMLRSPAVPEMAPKDDWGEPA